MSELHDPGNEKSRHFMAITVGVVYSSKKGFEKEKKNQNKRTGRMTSESDKQTRERETVIGCPEHRVPAGSWFYQGWKKTEEPSRR